MTAVLVPRVVVSDWQTAAEAAPVIGSRSRPYTCRLMRNGVFHAHLSAADLHPRAAQWFARRRVAVAFADGATHAEQVRLCGCRRSGWPPPPRVAGRARRLRPPA